MKNRAFDFKRGEVRSPVFLPDATFGVVRSVDAQDLEACGIEAVVMNTFHLMQHPGSSTIQALGGLHKMTGWQKPIITDSGGFQAYSLIRQNPKFGQIHEKGITFYPEGSDRKFQLTPEKTVQLQIGYGTDVVICLDDCTHVDEGYDAQLESVERTIAWAKKSKKEFLKLIEQKKLSESNRPKLFAVIQGGGYKELRKRCADALLEIGFDGYGYGGWPLDKDNHLLTEIIGYTREIIPDEFPMHALGWDTLKTFSPVSNSDMIFSTAPCPPGMPVTAGYTPLANLREADAADLMENGCLTCILMMRSISALTSQSVCIAIARVVAIIHWATCTISSNKVIRFSCAWLPFIICASWCS